MTAAAPRAADQPGRAILFVLAAMVAISTNDMLIKQLSGGYPLHQIVLIRSLAGLAFSLAILPFEGGLASLRTGAPVLHVARALAVVVSNMAFFAGLAVLPLADATALFFVAPLFITLLSIPLLGERVGPRRLIAVLIGFGGVLLVQRGAAGGGAVEAAGLALILPVVAAFFYALMQIMTRRLGDTAPASVMSIYIQLTFIAVGLGFFLIAGDGRFAERTTDPSLVFLLRAWTWPAASDAWLFVGLGANSAVIGYCLSAAYRLADAAVVAPYEYVALPCAVFWGWAVFGEWPNANVAAGLALIAGAGLFVFFREARRRSDAPRR